uniref:Peptidase M1 leukotriene A4 hydrolase/aminopeptidase C-terminal domain-containing protein n=1 Tax=Globisporangium ultimum (strain ATCC 200006 / CBS 805.95 / DAOM BR144) TaxID=431595 RepID=K3X8J9_GLOUD
MDDPATCAALMQFRMHHVALRVAVDMRAKKVAGEAELHITRVAGSTVAVLQLDVFHLTIHAVHARAAHVDAERDGGRASNVASLAAAWRVKPFTSFGDALEIELPLELVDAQAFVVTIQYETNEDSPGVCWLTKEQTAGKTLPYMYTQGQEVLNRSFFPCQDSPSVRITYTASVCVPAELVCVMSAKLCGVEESKTDASADKVDGAVVQQRWKHFQFEMTQSIPVYLVAMAVGDLVAAEVGPRSSIWTEPCMLEKATREFEGVIEKYLCIGESLFGEYVWERYDVLVMPPSFPYGGMENPRLTFVSPSLIAGDQSLSSVIAHEIAHSWFGNLATNATWSDFFLNEGFTMYAERRITEVAHGRSLMCLNAKLGEALLHEEIEALGGDSPLTRLRVPLEQGIDPGDCYNQCAYEKGYAFVSYLRSLAGSDKVFDDFLKAYCAKFRFQSIAAEDTLRFFLEYFPHLQAAGNASEVNGPISFSTWLHAPGYPQYKPELSEAQEIMEHCEALAYHWGASQLAVLANVVYLTEEARTTWPVFQRLYFLDCCLNESFANALVVIALGDTMRLWDSANSEVRFRWSLVLIKNEVLAKLDDGVGAFLESQGKQKFQIPVYRALTTSGNPKVRAFATQIYARTKASLHVMVRDRIELLLRKAESDLERAE